MDADGLSAWIEDQPWFMYTWRLDPTIQSMLVMIDAIHQRFADAGLIDRATAALFRDEVLSRGASRPAAESFRAFRGREPDPRALLERYGLADTEA
ncbi:MAG: M3 family metallopeptidase [Novosphingobium sp.]